MVSSSSIARGRGGPRTRRPHRQVGISPRRSGGGRRPASARSALPAGALFFFFAFLTTFLVPATFAFDPVADAAESQPSLRLRVVLIDEPLPELRAFFDRSERFVIVPFATEPARTRGGAPPAEKRGDEADEDGPTAAEWARRLEALDAEYLIFASIEPRRQSSSLGVIATLRVADGYTGQILFSTRAEGASTASASRESYERLEAWFSERPWRGRIQNVPSEGIVVLAAGHDEGIYEGLELEVLAGGEPILDPETGAELGATTVPIGRVQVDRVDSDHATARVVEGCADVAVGDRVMTMP